MTITHRHIEANGIHVQIAEAGTGPLVLLLHGFPELSYSWRHQLEALSAAGYHAVAPDQRGYGGTDAPLEREKYTMLHLVGDAVGVVQALEESRVVVIGHDWGSPVASNVALFRPDLVRGVGNLSVPYLPRGDADVLTSLRELLGPNNYQEYFQVPGVADAEMAADVRRTVISSLYGSSGDAPAIDTLSEVSASAWSNVELPEVLPVWLTEADVNHFTTEFERTGFTGALNWYRTSKENFELSGAWRNAPLTVPALFIGGDRDLVYNWPGIRDYIGMMGGLTIRDLRTCEILEGCGHWTQQERPDDVNRLLLEFLAGLDP